MVVNFPAAFLMMPFACDDVLGGVGGGVPPPSVYDSVLDKAFSLGGIPADDDLAGFLLTSMDEEDGACVHVCGGGSGVSEGARER